MNEKMKKALHETLAPDEKILWESDVQPYGILEGGEGRQLLFRWLICFAGIGGLAAAYANRGGNGLGLYFVALAALVIIVATPILSYRQTVGQHYCVTDRRAMTIRPDGSVYSMDRENLGETRLYKVDCGGEALALVSMLLAEKDRQLRWRANHPLEDSTYVLRGLVFYRPKQAEKAMRLLSGEGV